MSTINPHTTRAPGTILTATIYNADHVNHILNATNLNNDKLEGATPPVVDNHLVVFDGTGGDAIKTGNRPITDVRPAADNATALAGSSTTTDVTPAALAHVFLNKPATETVQGTVEMAVSSEIWSCAVGPYAVTAEKLSVAAAFQPLTDGATITFNWESGINRSLTIAGNRTLGNPSNGQPGTHRQIYVVGDGGTQRQLQFAANFTGDTPVLNDITSSRGYLLSIACISTSHFVVSAHRAT